jgi:hypothetical protein
VPISDGGETREPPFAGNEWIGEAAIRYALVLFFPELRQCSGNGRSHGMTAASSSCYSIRPG